MGEFRPLPVVTAALELGGEADDEQVLSGEERYWARFKHVAEAQQLGPVTSVEYSSSEPHRLAATSSTRVLLFDPFPAAGTALTPARTLSRFSDVAYSGSFRVDGRLLVAGGEDRLVQMFDLSSRLILRQFSGHKAAVHVARFAPDKTRLLSASDDRTVRGWDIADGRELFVLRGHGDYIRAGAVNPTSHDVWLSGGYDHAVCVWDVRAAVPLVRRWDHGAPVEALVAFGSGQVLATAGGGSVAIWDLVSGRRRLEARNHQKTITALTLDGSGSRLLSGALDQLVKVYDVRDLSVTHTIRCAAPILSIAVAPDNTHLALGHADNTLSVRHRGRSVLPEIGKQRAKQRQLWTGTYRYFLRGKTLRPDSQDVVVQARKRQRLAAFDAALKEFRFADALDAALRTRSTDALAAVAGELRRRHVLRTALSGRDEAALAPLLEVVVAQLAHPRHAELMLDLAEMLVELYASVLGQSPSVDALFVALQRRLRGEMETQRELVRLQGALDLLMAASVHSAPALDAAMPSPASPALIPGNGSGSGGGGGGGVGASVSMSPPPTPVLLPSPSQQQQRSASISSEGFGAEHSMNAVVEEEAEKEEATDGKDPTQEEKEEAEKGKDGEMRSRRKESEKKEKKKEKKPKKKEKKEKKKVKGEEEEEEGKKKKHQHRRKEVEEEAEDGAKQQ